MIKMKSPSLAYNSFDVPGPWYQMWSTLNTIRGFNTNMMVNDILRINNQALSLEGSQLLNIIINCHGWGGGGGLSIGGSGRRDDAISIKTVYLFAQLRGLNLGTIWLTACQAAKGESGKQLCLALAMHSGCLVIGADDYQNTGIWGSYRLTFAHNHIDEFEGTVFAFYPTGGIQLIDPHDDTFTILD